MADDAVRAKRRLLKNGRIEVSVSSPEGRIRVSGDRTCVEKVVSAFENATGRQVSAEAFVTAAMPGQMDIDDVLEGMR